MAVCAIRASPAPYPNWGKGCPGEPKTPPAQQMQPGFMVGSTSPGRPKGKFSPSCCQGKLMQC
ncbi:unnamed protein product [Prunus armeniaca]